MSSTSSKTAAFDRFPISDSGSIAIEHHKAQSDVEKAKRAKARDSDSEDPGNLISRDPEPSARRKSSVVNIEKIQVKDVKNPHVNHGNAEDPWADTPQRKYTENVKMKAKISHVTQIIPLHQKVISLGSQAR